MRRESPRFTLFAFLTCVSVSVINFLSPFLLSRVGNHADFFPQIPLFVGPIPSPSRIITASKTSTGCHHLLNPCCRNFTIQTTTTFRVPICKFAPDHISIVSAFALAIPNDVTISAVSIHLLRCQSPKRLSC